MCSSDLIDGLGSLWYCQVGHNRAELVQAITNQLQTLSSYHTFAPMGSQISDQAAERIRSVSPFPDGRVFLCSSGSESVDSAIKIMRKVAILRGEPERQIILRRSRGYHGGMFAGHEESGGELVEDDDGVKYKDFYGMSSTKAQQTYYGDLAEHRAPEGKKVRLKFKGPLD